MKLLFIGLLIVPFGILSQQIPDKSFHPIIVNPMYELGKGSVVYIDEGHHNFHTKNGRYLPFSNLIESDGYVLKSYTGNFRIRKLRKGKILVISNALHKKNVKNWCLPTFSAFTKEELKIIKTWVEEGGSLFLIADHMPMAEAASDLASSFGFEFTYGFAINKIAQAHDIFSIKEKTLSDEILTNGRNSLEKVEKIRTFTGQAFRIPFDAKSILTFDSNYVNKLPDTAWVFNENTKRFSVEGWSQGAYKKVGKGKNFCFW